MPETVSGCRSDVRSCSPEDRAIVEAASRDNVAHAGKPLPVHVTPNGPTRREVKQARATASAEAVELVRRFGQEIRAERFEQRPAERLVGILVERFGGLPGRVYGGVKMATIAHRLIVEQARETAVALDEAARRDGMNLFVLDVISSGLDRGYVASQRTERAASSAIAKGIGDRLAALPAPEFLSVLEGLKRSARDGVAAALEHGLRGLLNDPQLYRRYEAETAFRLGADSVGAGAPTNNRNRGVRSR